MSEQLSVYSVDSFLVHLRQISERAARRASNIVCKRSDSFLSFPMLTELKTSLPFGLGRSDAPLSRGSGVLGGRNRSRC